MHEEGGSITSGKVVSNPPYDKPMLEDLIKGCLGRIPLLSSKWG